MEAAYVSGVGSHDGQVVVVNDLLHQLDTSEVSEHVSDRDDVSVLDKGLRDVLSTLDLTGTDRLLGQLLLSRPHTVRNSLPSR